MKMYEEQEPDEEDMEEGEKIQYLRVGIAEGVIQVRKAKGWWV